MALPVSSRQLLCMNQALDLSKFQRHYQYVVSGSHPGGKFFGWRQMISNLICLAAPMLHMPCSCASQAVLLAQQLILSHPSCQLEQSAGTIMLPLSEERGCFGFCCLIGAWHVPRAGETWRCCGHGLRWAVGQSVNQADTRRGECIDSYVRIAL